MRLQGVPASPGVVCGFARRWTGGPDEVLVQVRVSATHVGTVGEPPAPVPLPVLDRREERNPAPIETVLPPDSNTSGDSAAARRAYSLPERVNSSLESPVDQTADPEKGRFSASRGCVPTPRNQQDLRSHTASSAGPLSAASAMPEPDPAGNRFIIVASTMTARELLRSCRAGAVGVILERCDWNSDTLLLARSLGLPLVCGLGAAVSQIVDQAPVILDGTQGIVTLPAASECPSGDTGFPEHLSDKPDFPEPVAAVTRDGITIRLLLTLEDSQHVDPQLLWAADGIGVWHRDRPHGFQWKTGSVGDFLKTFRAVADQLPGQELQIALALPQDRSQSSGDPDLGRSSVPSETIRDDLDFPIPAPRAWLIAQVQALLELAKDHPVTILLSQIESREDLETALATLGALAGDIDPRAFPFRVGLLLESPKAAVSADEWLPLVHSLTIDWDSLSRQMTDREHSPIQTDPLAMCLAPPVLRVLLDLAQSAGIHGTRLTLCGHLLGEPLWTAVALAIGFRRLSVTPWSFRSAQQTICQISDRGLGELRHLICSGASAGEIEGWLRQHMYR